MDTGDAKRCGTYTSLTFDSDDDPVIAYKCSVYDNLKSDWVETLKLARGVRK